MNKTPVSILQEIMVKKGMAPNYELVHDGGGTHMNTFTYQVTCDGLSATGTGRCKKDAKHEAAKAMLTAIAAHRNYPQLPASPAQSPVRTPLPDTVPISPRISGNLPFINAIGALQELCSENNLQDPEYIPISDVGPPHARVFTIRCVLSTFKEEGIATTKKQAKHEAAKKMIERISDIVAGLNLHEDENIINKNEMELANNIAKTRYPILTKLPLTKKLNLGMKLCAYHTAFNDSLDTDVRSKVLDGLNCIRSEVDKNITTESVAESLSKFESLLSEFSIKVNMNTIQLNTGHMKIIQIDVSPSLVEVGVGKTESKASFIAIVKMIDNLKLLLS